MSPFPESLQEQLSRQRTLGLLWEASHYCLMERARRLEQALKAGYNPNQPWVPAGNPDGGQWTGTGGGRGARGASGSRSGGLVYTGAPDLPIEPAYPIETALTFFVGGEVVAAVRTLRGLWSAGATASSRRMGGAAKAIEDYLGGPGVIKQNRAGDTIILRGNKKIRFDIKKSGKDKPHFHVEKEVAPGKWRDVGKHRNYFKDKK